jgi:SpoU rRNA methylase family enzyme
MSLLYQALLKNNQNKPVQSQNQEQQENKSKHSDLLTSQSNVEPSNSFHSQQFAGAHVGKSQNNLPWFVWLFIASLLLVVGLLAGYIYGNFKPSNNAATKTSTEFVENVTTENKSDLIPFDANLVANTETSEAEQTIEVAVNSQGQVVSKVTDKASKIATTNGSEQSAPSSTILEKATPEIDLSGVPDNLKASFAEAIKATEVTETLEANFEMDLSSNGNVLMLEDLTAYQTALLPDLIYQMHIFSSDVSERWVKINDKILYEGNELVPGLTLLEIKQNLIVWRFNNRKVGQLALVDFVQ